MLLLPGEYAGTAGSAPKLTPPTGPQPPCVTDEDCWSYTCCPPKAPNECVHHTLAQKCSVVDVTCPKAGSSLKCACVNHACETTSKS